MSNRRKTLQELTIKDNFMFAAVMLNPELCKGLLERVLSKPIDRVTVITEKNLVYHPEYKGVRLDVYAKDEKNTRFNVEMQIVNREIFKRSRYYHAQIDMELLETGTDYENLPDTYVIFICDFDPFGMRKYRYTIRNSIAEIPDSVYDNGQYTVFLSTIGQNYDEVPPSLVNFLIYVRDGIYYYEDDEFISKCNASITRIKSDREMGGRYMLFEELLKDEYKAGKEDGKLYAIKKILSSKGISESTIDSLNEKLKDDIQLDNLLEQVLSSDTSEKVEQLIKSIIN